MREARWPNLLFITQTRSQSGGRTSRGAEEQSTWSLSWLSCCRNYDWTARQWPDRKTFSADWLTYIYVGALCPVTVSLSDRVTGRGETSINTTYYDSLLAPATHLRLVSVSRGKSECCLDFSERPCLSRHCEHSVCRPELGLMVMVSSYSGAAATPRLVTGWEVAGWAGDVGGVLSFLIILAVCRDQGPGGDYWQSRTAHPLHQLAGSEDRRHSQTQWVRQSASDGTDNTQISQQVCMLISSLFNSMEQWLEYLDIQMYCHFKCRIMSETELEPPGENKQITERERETAYLRQLTA